MKNLQPVRGTHDLYGEDMARFQHIVRTASSVFQRFNYGQIMTPTFEFTNVFARTLGEESDVVSKEMYTFADRGGEEITLRPEGTAPIARALISNGWTQSLPLKLFYAGTAMFRYERPQKGRLRQHHQVGAELFGVESAQGDAELIKIGHQILTDLGLGDSIELHLNTLGDTESRTAYREALVAYFEKYQADLSEDSRKRLTLNPLRILDSKDDEDRKIIEDAPNYADFLNAASQKFFADLRNDLGVFGIPYTLNDRLVRGLDYYTHTVFEFVSDKLGAQATVLAGGRYDHLVKTLGGPDIPGVGFGSGIERLSLLVDLPSDQSLTITIIPVEPDGHEMALRSANDLQSAGYAVDLTYSGNMGKRLKRANKVGATHAVVVGPDEVSAGQVTVRDLKTGEQVAVAQDQLVQHFNAVASS